MFSEGTGKFYVPKGLDFAGKTGTSESFLDTNNDGKVDTATISSSFAGFYPSEDPKFSIVVITRMYLIKMVKLMHSTSELVK